MGIVLFPPSTITFQTVPNILLLTHIHKVKNLQTILLKQQKNNSYLHGQIFHRAKTSSVFSSIIITPLVPVKCKDDSFGETSDEDADCQTLEVVLRLYSAIKNRDLQGLSDLIGEECRCMSNFVFSLKPLHGKQHVMEFFITLMRVIGNHVEFVIQPTMHDGTNVGLQWTLTCSKTHAPLGKGFSFYTAHSYKGKLVIRNVEMFMEPIFHIEPLRLKLIGVMSNVIAQMGLGSLYKKKAKHHLLLVISLILMALSIFFFKLFLH